MLQKRLFVKKRITETFCQRPKSVSVEWDVKLYYIYTIPKSVN